MILDLHISLCSSLNQLQDTSINARFVQVNWSKLAASFFFVFAKDLLPHVDHTEFSESRSSIILAPGYGCAGIQKAQVASSDGALVSRFGKGHSI